MMISNKHSFIIQRDNNDFLSLALSSLRHGKAPQVTQAINNIIRARFFSRGGIEGCDFSGLDLRGVNIAQYINGQGKNKKTVFDYSYIERKNFFVEGPSDSIGTAFFSHDDKSIVTTSEDGKVCVWETDTGYLKSLYSGDGGDNPHLFSMSVFHPNDSLVAVACNDGRVLFLNSDNCKVISEIIIHKGKRGFIANNRKLISLAYDNSGDKLAIASNDSNVYLVDVPSRKVVNKFIEHCDYVSSVNFSRDNKMLVTASHDGLVIVWDVKSGEIINKFFCHGLKDHANCSDGQEWCLFANFTPSSDHIMVSTNNHDVVKWSINDNLEPVFTLNIIDTVCDYIAFSPIRDEFLVATCFNEIIVCDMETGNIIKKFDCLGNNKHSVVYSTVINCVDFNNTGTKIIAATDGGEAYIYNSSNSNLITTISGHLSKVRYMCIYEPLNHLATATDDGYIFIWNYKNSTLEHLIMDADKVITAITYSGDGRHFAASTLDGKVYVYNIENGYSNAYIMPLINNRPSAIDTCEFSPDDKLIATSSYNDSIVYLLTSSTGEIFKELSLDCHVFSAEFSNGGQYILVSGQDNCVYVFDTITGDVICKLSGHTDRVISSKFDADDKIIVSASLDNTAIIWDFKSRTKIALLKGSTEINDVLFNGNGVEVIAFDGNSMRVWNKFTGDLICLIGDEDEPVLDADFSNDGKLIAVVYYNRIELLETATFNLYKTINEEDVIFNYCVFSEDDNLFVSIDNSYVYVYELAMCDKLLPRTILDHNYNPKLEGCTFNGTHFDDSLSERDIRLLRTYEKRISIT